MKRRIIFLNFFITLQLFFCNLAFSQDSIFDSYVYQVWNDFGGLVGTTANDIVQTSDGYINIATYVGLVRFDGIEFTTIRKSKNNDLNFTSVRVILEDMNKNLWIGSNDEGLQLISNKGNVSYTTENGLPNNSVRALCEDKNGNIWIGTASGIVYLTPEGEFVRPKFCDEDSSKSLIAVKLYCDTAGRIWFLTENYKGLYIYTNNEFSRVQDADVYGNYIATAITQDLQGDFWIAFGPSGLAKIHNGKLTKITSNTMADTISCWDLNVNKDGSVWIGTEKGLVLFSNGKFYEYKTNNQLISKINKIITDREGNIWLATDRKGIGKLNSSKFSITKLGTASNAICEDFQERFWVGTDEGVFCFDEQTQIKNRLTEFTKGKRIRDVHLALNGEILVSCYSQPSQIRYNPKTNTLKNWTTEDGLSGDKVRLALETNPGEIYVGTTTGLSIIHSDGSIKNFSKADGLENDYVMAIYKDKNGVIWIGTDGGGIYLMKDEQIIANFSTDEGLAGNVIFKITQDKQNNFWISTGNGISKFSNFDATQGVPKEISNFNADNGLQTNAIFQVIFDQNSNAWMVSNYGISSAPIEDFNLVAAGKKSEVNVRFYKKNDGLDSAGATSTACAIRDQAGRLWFPMVDGYAIYDPVKNQESHVIPLVHIESVTIDNIEYKYIENSNLVLKPGTKRIDIKYTGLSFDAPEQIQFTYKLTNFDKEFCTPSKGRIVSYTNLNPGKHSFCIKAISGSGIESDIIEALFFVQKPYPYQMPIFWIIMAVIVLGIIVAIFYLRQRAMRQENLRLEKMVKLRTSELQEEKNKSDHLLRAILPDKIANELRDNIHSIGENFDDVTLLFSDIVSFTKTSSGHTAQEIVSSLNNLFSRFDERAKKMGVEKIKTIGDAYMAACGIPTPNENHTKIMVEFAKGMYQDLEDYNKTATIKFGIRIGLNCGPVTAGVIGKTKFIYDVWGDTVNVASRMETACNPGGIRVTEAVKNHLAGCDFVFSTPIQCDIKGKGMMTTYEIL